MYGCTKYICVVEVHMAYEADGKPNLKAECGSCVSILKFLIFQAVTMYSNFSHRM